MVWIVSRYFNEHALMQEAWSCTFHFGWRPLLAQAKLYFAEVQDVQPGMQS
eukprot:SAG31_NODE_3286_length_4460_cov_2.970649_2_plen_51_part_00